MTNLASQASAERSLESLTRILDRTIGLVVAGIMFFMMILTFIPQPMKYVMASTTTVMMRLMKM